MTGFPITQAIILAAGRGERLRPLTDRLPKPLLSVGGITLIDHHLHALRRAGFHDCVINVAHLGPLIEAHVGNGLRYGLNIRFSPEPAGALETGGGIRQALPLLTPAPFLAVNADIYTDFNFQNLTLAPPSLAHLILVKNPAHNRLGDFTLCGDQIGNDAVARFTFSGIALYTAELFNLAPSTARFPLAPLLREAANLGRVTGALHTGRWFDIGTSARLEQARRLAPSKALSRHAVTKTID